jgi:hypothetical protein
MPLVVWIALTVTTCGVTTGRANDMEDEDKIFFQVPLDSTAPSACSPVDPGPEWRGVMIRAPKDVPVATRRFPLCGFYNLDMASLEGDQPLVVYAVERASKRTYQAEIAEADASPEAPRPELEPVDPVLLEGMAVGGYFNHNLFDYLQLPATRGAYDVFVQFGREKSNTVTVNLID